MSEDKSRVWLITGASSGFGKRMVSTVLARGDRVIATARSLEKLENSLATIQDRSKLRISHLDVTEGEDKIKSRIQQAVSFWGQIDVLVNNAGEDMAFDRSLIALLIELNKGVGLPGLMEEGGTNLLRRQLQTNLFGVLDATNATLPYLRQSKVPCLVVIGSRSAWKDGFPGLGHYAASKAAVHAITEAFMSELAQFDIKVLLVEPGAFWTEGINGQVFYTENAMEEYDSLRKATKAKFSAIDGTQKGDPNKAAEAIVDVIRGEGVSRGRPWPNYLFLGEDAEFDVRSKCSKMLNILDEWADVTRGVNLDDAPGLQGQQVQ